MCPSKVVHWLPKKIRKCGKIRKIPIPDYYPNNDGNINILREKIKICKMNHPLPQITFYNAKSSSEMCLKISIEFSKLDLAHMSTYIKH